MPVNPTPSTAITRPDLAATFDEFDLAANRLGFVGLQLFPVFEANKQNAKFKKRTIKDLLKEAETLRASGGDYPRSNWRFTEDSYATSDHGFEETVDDRESEIYADYFDAEADSAEQARDIVVRNHERRVVNICTDNANFNTTDIVNDNSNTKWTDPSSAKPIDDVRDAKITIYNRTGLMPNAIALNWELFQLLRDNSQILDRIKYSGDASRGNITLAVIAQAFDVERVLVSGGVRNTADELSAASLSPIWPKAKVMVGRVTEPNAPLNRPCVGRTIHWGEDGSVIGGLMESYRPEGARYSVVRTRMDTDEKLMYSDAAQLLTNVA